VQTEQTPRAQTIRVRTKDRVLEDFIRESPVDRKLLFYRAALVLTTVPWLGLTWVAGAVVVGVRRAHS